MQYIKPQLEELGSVHALTLMPTVSGQGQIHGGNADNGKTQGVGDGIAHANNGFS